MLALLIVWVLVALAVAVVVGRGIRLADAPTSDPDAVLTTGDLPAASTRDPVAGRH